MNKLSNLKKGLES